MFKKTSQQDLWLVRWGYGLGGALLSAGFGVFLLWFALIALRLLGTVAETEIRIAQASKGTAKGAEVRDPGAFVHFLADAKNSVDKGPGAEFVGRFDPLPTKIYAIMGDLTRVLSSQTATSRLIEFPGVEKLARLPKMRSLLDDPEAARATRERKFWELLKNKRVVEALNDPKVLEMVRKVELEKALDFALRGEGKGPGSL